MRRTIIAALVTFGLFATACSIGSTSPTTTLPPRPIPRPSASLDAVPASQALQSFDQCEAFLDHVIAEALELVGPYGLQPGGGYWPWRGVPELAFVDDVAFMAEGAPVTTMMAGGEDQLLREGDDFSQTNLQEAGVDEPDIVKTDGTRIIALSQGTLFVVDVTGDTPKVTGEIQLQEFAVRDLFLQGDDVFAIGAAFGGAVPYIDAVAPESYYPTPTSQVVQISLGDDDPEIVRTLEFDGSYISARMVDGVIRVVISSTPHGFVWAVPEGGGLKAERDAEEENRNIVRNSTIDNWVPYFVLSDDAGRVLDEGNLVECDRAYAPLEFAGLNMLSVLTIAADGLLGVVDGTGVLASGETVYASTDSLYVATQRWVDWSRITSEEDILREADTATTDIHMFDISKRGRTDYVASGAVTGYLLNQFAMSEHDGHLRVASTTRPDWWGGGERSESMVTVLEADDGALKAVGMVDGLGKGERIYSVRFMGDVGFVVTFRQVDPLYTIDLSEPTDPTVEGELKILGYSAYLHPVSDELLLGIGQDATEQGQILGTQVSLFDVSDLSDPRRVAQLTLDEGTNSQVEYDHRAFLYWDQTGLAMLPIQSWSWEERSGKESVFFGAIGVEVDEDGITSLGRVSHPGGTSDDGSWDWMAQIHRSIVIGDDVYTVSQKGVMKSDIDTLEREAFASFFS